MENIRSLKDEEKNLLLLEVIGNSTVTWLKDFVKAFEDKFGVTAAMPVAIAGQAAAAGSGGEPAEKKEEKTSFDVILQGAGANKIQVIKVIRAITNLGLKEAKTLTDTPPQPIKTGVSKEEGDKIVKDLTEAGAKVELK
ncbi:MAG: 50S ribosomal protein L7/L12 [Planctomycetota bacterium]|nr:50S ribosomal protein L7/L12 [Planctomycetota bacterium]MDI6786920.1 50S ribosomal protein L7/L12 [Planctomycetota bacterium]